MCDVSIINKDANSRLTPNPNVLIELGYAMKTLGEGKFIMVMNTAFGTPEQLPFDLRMRRVITYNMPVDSKDKATERNNLAKSLERQLRTILEKLEEEIKREMSIVEKAKVELKKNYPGSSWIVKKYMKWLDNQIEELAPKFSEKTVEKEDLLIKAIEQTEELVIEFASLAEVITTTKKSTNAAISLYQGFGKIVTHYCQPIDLVDSMSEILNKYQRSDSVSTINSFDFDFYRFMGHELFVTYFSLLIRENRWELISEILKLEIFYPSEPWSLYLTPNIPLNDISQPVELFKKSSNNRHSDILKQRHTNGKIAEIVPMQEFIEADFFLFILSESQTKDSSNSYWYGWSLYYMEQTPRYLLEAKKVKFAEQLLKPLDLETIEELLQEFRI
ncbi:MAG: hypothetical protein SWX82_27585 [Cyanobacteriota bacterium]|nr:hypothetical protein [Cyanobacteriota bacterium]